MIGAHSLSIHGQTLSLLPQRALYWHEEKTLIVADVHIGKSQTFQRAGIAVPGQVLQEDLNRLTQLVSSASADRLLILGDFVHHRSGLTKRVCEEVEQWCENLNAEIMVIVGNHDRPNRRFLSSLPLVLQEHGWDCGPFGFYHDEADKPSKSDQFLFFGHTHPVIFKNGLRLPVFAFYRTHCIMPAFSIFTGGSPLERRGLVQAFIPLEDEAVAVLTSLPPDNSKL